jgi:hypothetical protein
MPKFAPGLAGTEEHPSAEHGGDQGGDTDVNRGVVAGGGVILYALPPSSPGIRQAEHEEHGARYNKRYDPQGGIQHDGPPD